MKFERSLFLNNIIKEPCSTLLQDFYNAPFYYYQFFIKCVCIADEEPFPLSFSCRLESWIYILNMKRS